MSEYQNLSITPPESVEKIAAMVDDLKTGLSTLIISAKASMAIAKLNASGVNLGLKALELGLDAIITEIEKLKGGKFSGIVAHPYAHGIISKYDRITDTMTLSPNSALQQIKEAFDDEGDTSAPDKVNNYGGIVVVGSAPGVEGFGQILDAIGGFFSLQELLGLKAKILERWEEKKAGTVAPVELSSGLDFYIIFQEEIFLEYVELFNDVQGFFEGIKSGIISSSKNLDDMMEYLDKKLVELESIVRKISMFLDKFVFEISESGVHYKIFKSDEHTVKTIKKELLEGTPDSWKTIDYSVVFGLFAGSESIELIFELLSLD